MSNKLLAKDIFFDALEVSQPHAFIPKHCSLDGDVFFVQNDSYDLRDYENIYVFGSGKAAFTMAKEIEKILTHRIHKGIVVVPSLGEKLDFIEVLEGSHPLPSEKSIASASKLFSMMQECTQEDLFIYLLSGGSSALIELPLEGIVLDDMQIATQVMLHNGLTIKEINSVRKHISKIKGGRLLEDMQADGIVLVLSDVIGDDLGAIGSAPTYADTTTYEEAVSVLKHKKIFELMPKSVQEVLHKGLRGEISETPKLVKENIKHYVLASNTQALEAAKNSALKRGLSVKLVEEPMQGDVNAMVDRIITTLKQSNESCILFGGECTVEVDGDGKGGRNQHLVALMLERIYKESLDICFLSAGTDGIDGNSSAAGAVVDLKMQFSHDELKSAIDNFDSNGFFERYEAHIISGPTGTNVIDIALVIKE